jgi:hypothetical protein
MPRVLETLFFRTPESLKFDPLNSTDYGREDKEVFRTGRERGSRGRQPPLIFRAMSHIERQRANLSANHQQHAGPISTGPFFG